MIDRDGAEFDPEFRPAGGLELLRVQLGREAGAPPRLDYAARLLEREDAGLAEDVAEPRPPGDRGNHLVNDRVDVLAATPRELARHLVRPHEGRDQVDRLETGDPPDHVEDLDLVLRRQAVAALRLGRRRPVLHHPPRARPRLAQQFRRAGLPHPVDGREDPAARLRDLHITRALEAHLELALARPGEDEVRVRIDQSRRDDPPHRVERPPRAEPLPHRPRGADADAPAADRDRAVGEDREILHLAVGAPRAPPA